MMDVSKDKTQRSRRATYYFEHDLQKQDPIQTVPTYLPFVSSDIAVSLLKRQLCRILWVVHIVQEESLLAKDDTDLQKYATCTTT